MFDERHFPCEYQCEGCDREATVTHEDVQDVPTYFRVRPPDEAVEYVMSSRREWSIEPNEVLCPGCVDVAY